MAKLTAQINADASQFLDVIKAVLKSAEEAQKAIQKAFGESGDIKVNDSAIKDAIDSANKLSKELKSMSGDVDVNDSEIDSAAKKVKQLDGSTVKIDVEADTSGLDSLKDAFSGGLIGGLAGGGIASLVETGIGAIVGGLGAAYEAGNQLNTALGDLQAKTGATSEEFKALKQASEDAFIGGVGESVAEATNIIANAQVRLGDFLDPKQLSEFTIGAQALGNTFDLDVNEVITKASPVIKQFGLNSEEAFNLFALSMQKGSSASDDILDTLSEYSQLAQEAGFSALEFGESIARGAEAGVFNTDKIGDAIKEAGIRLKAGDFTSAFKGLSESANEGEKSVISLVESIAQKAQSGELSIQDALQLSSAEIDKAFNAGEISDALASNLQTAMAGTPAEDLGRDVYSRIFSAPLNEEEIKKKAQEAGKSLSGAIGQYTSFDAVQRKFELGIAKISQAFIAFSDKIIAPIIGGIIEAFSGIQDAFDSVFGDFDAGSGIMDFLQGLIGVFNIIVGLVRDRISAVFRAVFGTIKGILGAVGTAISPLINLLKDLFNGVSEGGGFFEKFGEVMKDVGDIVGQVGGFIFDLLITPLEFLIDIIVDIVSGVGGFITSLFGVSDAGKFFSDILDNIGNALNNIKGTIGGVISAFKAFKEAIKNLDFGKVVSDLLSGKNPFAGITDSLSSAYDEGFNKATDKTKTSLEEQGKLFEKLNKQIQELSANKGNLSTDQLAKEKQSITASINANLEANKLIKGEAVQLQNALEQIKIAGIKGTVNANTKTKASFKDLGDFLTTDFQETLKGAFSFDGFGNELQLSDSFVNVEGILEGFKQPIEEFQTALTGIRLGDDQLDTIKAFNDDLSESISHVQSLKNNLEQTPQYLKNLVDETGKLSSEFGKYANENDKSLSKLKTDLSNIQIEFNSAGSEEQQVEILNRLLAKYNEYNKQVIKTANVSKDDRLKLEEKYQRDLEALQGTVTGLTTEQFNKQLELLNKQRDESLKIQADRIAKTKEAEQGLLDFFENRRVDAITDENEKAKTKELKDLDVKYKELISKYGINEESITKLREAFAIDRAGIVEKYTVKEVNLIEDLAKQLSLGLANYDNSGIIAKNKEIENSIGSVKSKYKEDTDALQEQLRNKEISTKEYNEKIIELGEEKNGKLQALQDQQIGFIDAFQLAFTDSLDKMAESLKTSLEEQNSQWNLANENFVENSENLTSALESTLTLAGAQFAKLAVDGEVGFKQLTSVVLSSVSSIIDLLIAQIVAQGAAAAPFGLGVPAALGLAALVKGLLSAAQASIGGANDGVIGLNEGNKGKPKGADSIHMMLAPGESVITAMGTNIGQNRAYLDFINRGGNIADLITPNVSINPKYANSTNMNDTNKRLDQTNRELAELRRDMRGLRVNHFYDKQPTVNVNNTIEIKSQRGRV